MENFYKNIIFRPVGKAGDYPVSQQTFPGANIRDIVMSVEGQLIIRTAVTMAPNLPTAVAFEEVFEELIGDAAFSNDMKQYTGYLIRQVVEGMGGQLVEKGVKIKRRSRYTRGSIYSL